MKSFWKPLSWDNCSSLRNLHTILFEVSNTWTRRKKRWGYAAFFLQTTNRHAKYVVENAVLRFTIQQQINSKPDTKKQILMISHQSKLLEKHGNSFYLNEFVKKKSSTVSSEEQTALKEEVRKFDWARTAENVPKNIAIVGSPIEV